MPIALKIPGNSALAWWNLSRKQKDALQAGRMAGKYGGVNAVGAGRAPYAWVQEFGESRSAIKGQHFMEESWDAFFEKAPDLIKAIASDLKI